MRWPERLPFRRIDDAERVVRDHGAGEHFRVAQQPLEALLRRRLPAVERAALVGIDAAWLDAHQELPASLGGLRRGDRPGWGQRRRVLGQRNQELGRHSRPAGARGDMARLPAEHLLDESPGIADRGFIFVLIEQRLDRARVEWGLADRHKPQFLEHGRRHDETDPLGIIEPFEVRVESMLSRHRDQPDAGHR